MAISRTAILIARVAVGDLPTATRGTDQGHRMDMLASLALVIAGTAAALGLGAVTLSLMPSPGGVDDPTWAAAPTIRAGDDASSEWSRDLGRDRTQRTAMAWQPEIEFFRAVVPRGSATGQPTSPLYPKIGVTLWDRIQVSSPKDRRAFLMGTAIQIHARAAAATPVPQYALQHPHGVD